MKPVLTLLLAGLSLYLPSAQAARRVGELQVRADANGQPCFTISEREEGRGGSPDFQSITVSEGPRILWRMAMPRERTFPMNASMCVPYGGRVPALPQTQAVSLDEGKTYVVALEVRPGKDMTVPLRYQGRFCLKSGRPGRSDMRDREAEAQPARGLDACLVRP